MERMLAILFAMMVSVSASAGSVNTSTTKVWGTGSSVTQSNGASTTVEGAVGVRHLDASSGNKVSVRDEKYIRGAIQTGSYSEKTKGQFSTVGTIKEAGNVGTSAFYTTSKSRTKGSSSGYAVSKELGLFRAYESTGGSYGYEVGGYMKSSVDYSSTDYKSKQRTRSHEQSAYTLDGIN